MEMIGMFTQIANEGIEQLVKKFFNDDVKGESFFIRREDFVLDLYHYSGMNGYVFAQGKSFDMLNLIREDYSHDYVSNFSENFYDEKNNISGFEWSRTWDELGRHIANAEW